jgi:hypothetical protein
MMERRITRRRNLPFIKSAVLRIGEREHIITVFDLSPEGAYLATRLAPPIGSPMTLKMVPPTAGQTVAVSCRLVWRNERADPATGRPAGLAIRFEKLSEEVRDMLEAYAVRAHSAKEHPGKRDRFEYRLLDRDALDAKDLNALGEDGWQLVAIVGAPKIERLVLMRRR